MTGKDESYPVFHGNSYKNTRTHSTVSKSLSTCLRVFLKTVKKNQEPEKERKWHISENRSSPKKGSEICGLSCKE